MKSLLVPIPAVLSLVICGGAYDAPAKQSSTERQGNSHPNTAADSRNLPIGTAFLAKLSTNLMLSKCKPGDPIEAEAKQDVKQGKQVMLKKGSILLGRVSTVQLATAEKPENRVEIVFDAVKMAKNGQNSSLHLIVQALAPEADVTNNGTLADGRGLDSATNTAGISGHSSTIRGSVNELNSTSTGIYDLSGVSLGEQVSSTGHTTILAASVGDFRLKKGMQLVLRVVEQ